MHHKSCSQAVGPQVCCQSTSVVGGPLHGLNSLYRLSTHCACILWQDPTPDTTSTSHLDHHAAGLTSDYCDDFVCTSSPAVEQNLRALSRDLTRLNTWTISLFAKDVQYQVSEHPQQLQCQVCQP